MVNSVVLKGLRPVCLPEGAVGVASAGPLQGTWLGRSYRALCMLAEGRMLVCDDSRLGWIYTDRSVSAFYGIGGAAVEAPRCAVGIGGLRVLVMDSLGAVEVFPSGAGWECRRVEAQPGRLRFRAVPAGILSETVDERKLSRSYGSTVSLAARDARALANDYRDAYERAASRAAGMGLYLHPVVAQGVYYGYDGAVLHRGAPCLVGLPEPGEGMEPRELFSADGQTVGGYSVDAPAYRLEATLEGCEDVRVARVEILVTPQFHPFSGTGQGEVTGARHATAEDVFARVALPGRSLGLCAGSESSHSRLRRVLGRLENLQMRAAVTAPGFAAKTVAVPNVRTAGPAAEAAELERALVAPPEPADYEQALLDLPNTVVAGCVAGDAETLLWGNLSVRRFAGYDPSCMSADAGDKPWRALVTVFFGADGAGVRRSVEFTSGNPLGLGPVLSYPAPDATAMDIIMFCDGVTRRGRFELSGDGSGRRSVYISPDFRPLTLPAVTAAQVTELADSTVSFGNMVAVAAAVRPLELRLRGTAGRYAVRSLCLLGGGDRSWEFGRSRFVAATAEGLFSVGAGNGRLAVRLLDHRGVADGHSLAGCGEGVFAATEGGLLMVDGNSRRICLLSTKVYQSVAWVEARREVFAAGDDGADRFCADYGYHSSAVADEGISAVFMADGKGYARRGDTLLHLDREDAGASAPLRLDYVFPGKGPLRAVRLGLTGTLAEGAALTVSSADVEGRDKAACVRASLRGEFRGVVLLPCPMRACPRHALRLEGTGNVIIDKIEPVYRK